MNPIDTDKPTAEEIARHYSAAMDSVNLLNAGKPASMSDADWADCKRRNVEHLEIMLAKVFWTTEDLEPLRAAVEACITVEELMAVVAPVNTEIV